MISKINDLDQVKMFHMKICDAEQQAYQSQQL